MLFLLFQYPFFCYAGNYSCSCYQRLPSNSTCESALELSSDIKKFSVYCLHYLLDLKSITMQKSTHWISFKLTAFNNDTSNFLNINFLRDQLSFKVTKSFIIFIRWCHSCVLWSCENKNQLEFFQNIKFKWSNEWFLRIRHHSCALVYILYHFM